MRHLRQKRWSVQTKSQRLRELPSAKRSRTPSEHDQRVIQWLKAPSGLAKQFSAGKVGEQFATARSVPHAPQQRIGKKKGRLLTIPKYSIERHTLLKTATRMRNRHVIDYSQYSSIPHGRPIWTAFLMGSFLKRKGQAGRGGGGVVKESGADVACSDVRFSMKINNVL